jgi:hypothetical protein
MFDLMTASPACGDARDPAPRRLPLPHLTEPRVPSPG